MARIKIEDLETKGAELSKEEMGEVTGGWVRYRHSTQRRVIGYRYQTYRRRVPVVAYRRVTRAYGTRYGRWTR